MNAGIAFLMYHELELPGRELCQSDPGYTRYIVPASGFESQMRCLKELGYQGVSVSQSLAGSAGKKVVITFDDGCATDVEAAAPVLCELNFSATFYVTAGFLGRRGFMTAAQLRELLRAAAAYAAGGLAALEDLSQRQNAGAIRLLAQMR